MRSVVLSGLVVASVVTACGSAGGGGNGGAGGSLTGIGGTGTAGSAGAAGAGGSGGGPAGAGGSGAGSPPGAFDLTMPLHGSSAQPLTPTLSWSDSYGADSYTVEIATSASFGAADVVNMSVTATVPELAVPASTLTAGVIYHWRVTAVNAAGSTAATSGPRRFSSPYLVANAHGIAVTPDGTRLVVASSVNNGPIKIVTLASHAVTASIDTGVASQPIGVAVSPDGTQALVTLLGNGAGGIDGIAAVDLGSNSVTSTVSDPCVGTTLGDIAYFPTGARAAIPDLSPGCAAMGLTTFSASPAPSSFAFVNFSDTNDPMGVAISPDGTFALVTMLLDARLYRVTFPSTVEHLTLSSASAGVAITPDGSKAVVAAATADVVNLADGTITPVPLLDDTPGGDFHNVAITPDGTKAVVVGGATVQVISLSDNTIAASYPASTGNSIALSRDGLVAFVTDGGNGWVRVIQIP